MLVWSGADQIETSSYCSGKPEFFARLQPRADHLNCLFDILDFGATPIQQAQGLACRRRNTFIASFQFRVGKLDLSRYGIGYD